MKHKRISTTPGIGFFALFVFVLVAIPKINVSLGPVPLYFIDLMIVSLLWMAQRRPAMKPGQRRFAGAISTILLFALISELVGAFTFGALPESIYIAVRTCLAVSVFFITGQFVRTPRDVEIVLRAVVVGVLLTASLMILTSLPMTRTAVSDLVFSHSFLEPASQNVRELLVAGETGVRGRTLVGVSILGASFINICWPLAALFIRWPWPMNGLWRQLALLACLLAPMGVLMSYSRGPIIGAILIVLAALFLGLKHVRRGVIFPVLVGATVVASVGITSQIFFFDRLTKRSEAMLEKPFADERESERILAYVEPFEHMMQHPRFLVAGEGLTVRYAEIQQAPEQAGKATHAIFAMAYYCYGLIASIIYLSLIIRALFFTGALSRQGRSFTGLMSQSLFLSMVAIVPWAVFGHAAISTPRGAMLFFLIFGLISSLVHFRAPVRRFKPVNGVTHVQRRTPAFR
ncbi:hypothetical protein G5B40_11025 [Pikeienuella piscinae]|uniref:O-antigen ligase-related domain-containing protein n=1 Tax=Pikeienuella piscinae TaxID=2748098 RepID=A0A7L5C090_9RHOB|nr:O-antigen ligase family protein [Pikeienuella piscinae]QIE55936.1 hypothetical protein G5B40_11025 [Pikeienuella piscinae]